MLHQRPLAGAALAAVALFLLAGCSAFRQSSLAAYETPNCSQAAGIPLGLFGSLLGHRPRVVNWSGCEGAGLNLDSEDLSIANLGGANLRGADLEDANLTGANLTLADLSGARMRNVKLLGASVYGANLSKVDLSDTDLTGVGLEKVNFSGANLQRADLTGANLRGAKLDGADLSGATWVYGQAVCRAGSIGRCLR